MVTRRASQVDARLEISVAHTLETHLDSILVIYADAIVLTPCAYSLQERAMQGLKAVEVVPKLKAERVLDAVSHGSTRMRAEVVVGDNRLLLAVWYTDSNLPRLTCSRYGRRLTGEEATDASILGTLVREAYWSAVVECQPLDNEGLELEINDEV